MDGYMIDVEFDGQTLTVRPKNRAAGVALSGPGHGDEEVSVPRAEIAAVTLKHASMFVNGNLTVHTVGGRKYQLHFRKRQADGFTALAATLDEGNRTAAAAGGPRAAAAEPRGARTEHARREPRLFHLWGQVGWCGFEVVGESHYGAAIRALLPKHVDHGAEVDNLVAYLVPEPNNRHDPRAVRVDIGGRTVGYLPAEEAARYSPVLRSLVGQGWQPVTAARLWGAEFTDGRSKEVRGSVRLDLGDPHMLVPINQPPSSPWSLLPKGHAVQVTGEDQCMSVLTRYTRPELEASAFVTLHPLLERTARTERRVVETRIDGQRVGQLTPKMSGDFLPAIDHVEGGGGVLACRAVVKGNQLKAEVVLYGSRAHELTDDWLRLPLRAAGTFDGQ